MILAPWACPVHWVTVLFDRSPEKVVQWLDSLAFIEEQLKITCFAIDESHCISSQSSEWHICSSSELSVAWGPQFRPAYRDLAVLRQRFPRVPIMALTGRRRMFLIDDTSDLGSTTATATPSVQDDIIASLLLRNPFILKTSFDRPNLFYSVSMKTSLAFDIPRALLQHGSSIIYCLRQQDTVVVPFRLHVKRSTFCIQTLVFRICARTYNRWV